jgi:hypothetical protein
MNVAVEKVNVFRAPDPCFSMENSPQDGDRVNLGLTGMKWRRKKVLKFHEDKDGKNDPNDVHRFRDGPFGMEI